MSNIIFGLDWSAEQDLEKAVTAEIEFSKAHNNKVKNGKKLTPAQHRDATHKEIADAITNGNPASVQQILDDNPNISLHDGSFYQIHTALLKSFDTQIAKILSRRRLNLKFHDMKKEVEQNLNIPLIQHFIERSKQDNKEMEFYLELLYHETLRSYDPKLSTARRSFLRSYRLEIEKSYPAVYQKVNANFYPCFTHYQADLPADDVATLKTYSSDQWTTVFRKYFEKIFERATLPTAQNVQNIMRFTSDFPHAQIGWNNCVVQHQKRHENFTAVLAQFWDPKVSYENSHLKTMLYKYGRSHYGSEPYTNTPRLEGGNIELAKMMGLSEYEMLPFTKGFPSALKWKDGAPNALTSFTYYKPASFVHLLIESCSPAAMALLESPEGRERHFQALSDPHVLIGWCAHATPSIIHTVVKACPQWKNWTDHHGNTLGHYLTCVRFENTKTFAQTIIRLNHEWVFQENKLGTSVKDMFKKNRATEETLIALDHATIKKSLQEAGLNKTKRDAQAPVVKRKM